MSKPTPVTAQGLTQAELVRECMMALDRRQAKNESLQFAWSPGWAQRKWPERTYVQWRRDCIEHDESFDAFHAWLDSSGMDNYGTFSVMATCDINRLLSITDAALDDSMFEYLSFTQVDRVVTHLQDKMVKLGHTEILDSACHDELWGHFERKYDVRH